ncbi:MAG: OmpA family protein [Sulfuritalea sp.]|nr:OmpA family protein [Sulfuritalea sp.]MCF8184800.1 OmpA family protein [Polynucleobacter sp.]
MDIRLILGSLFVSFACGGALAADAEARQTVSINSPNPSAAEVDEALFPKGIAELKTECAQMEKIGLRCQSVIPKSALDTVQVTFAVGSAALTEEAKGFLRSIGASLQRKAGVWQSVAIEGHTDSSGSDATNRRLSKARADSVKGFLVAEFGLSNIETVGRADERLRDTENPTSAQNRRVEFIPNW